MAIVKNEEHYIADWLRFHALAGVLHFIIYDNQSDDFTMAVIQSFSTLSFAVIPWALNTLAHSPKMILPRQILAYYQAICNFGSAYRWIGFIDIDEFGISNGNVRKVKDESGFHVLTAVAMQIAQNTVCAHRPWRIGFVDGSDKRTLSPKIDAYIVVIITRQKSLNGL